jgi:cytosine/adenosine deaminase-related metal-dependent hydrolase
VAEWAAHRAVPVHAHVSEQPAENETSRATYGATPTALLFAAGALTEAFTAVHATHLVGADRALLLDAGATVCICPTTERDLGDGLVELAPLVAAAIPIAVGTDSQATVDAFEELRCLEGHERLRTHERGTCTPALLLASATESGHRALGRPDGGRIAPGAPCDLVAVSTTSARLSGFGGDVGGVLAGASAADVRTVVVAGEVVVEDGRHLSVDAPRVLDDAVRAVWA